MSTSYTVYFNGHQFGPHTDDEIAAMLANGSIDVSASVHTEGWPDWRPVSSVIRPIGAQPVHAAPLPDGLDQLAALGQHDSGGAYSSSAGRSSSARASSRPGKGKRPGRGAPKSKRNLYIGLGAGGGALLLLLGIVLAVSLGGKSITVHRRNVHNSIFYWQITNDARSTLTITRVVFNGEHNARMATETDGIPSQSQSLGPVTLGGGDSQIYFERSDQGSGPEYYLKPITFVDIYTSRGNFRYSVDSGFSSEQPEYDEKKAAASDEEMDAESRKIDDKRRGVIHNMFQ